MPSMGGRLGQSLSRLGNIRLGAGPSAAAAATTRPLDRTLPYLGHLYDNAGNFKRMLDPLLSRPPLKQVINGGYQPIMLELPLPVRQYSDVVSQEVPAAYYRCGDASGNLTDQQGGPSLAPTVLDKSASMSFGNAPALTGGDATTSLKNAMAAPTSGYIFCPNDLYPAGIPANWTIEFMFLARTASDINSPMFRHQGVNDGSGNPGDVLMIYIDATGKVQFHIHPALTGLSFDSATGFAPTLNAPHLLELVNTAGNYTLYIDGVLRYTSGGTYQCTLGQSFEACAHPGSMQELAIYSTSLSGAQCAARQVAVGNGTYRASVLGDNPTGYWRLGDPAGVSAAEPTTGTARLFLKTPLYGQVPLVNDDAAISLGSVGNGFGVGGNAYFSSTTAQPITGTKFSIGAWILPGALTRDRFQQGGSSYIGGRCIVKVGTVGAANGFSLTHDGPDIVFGANSAGLTAANLLTAGRHRVMWVHDSSLGTPDTIYIDGVAKFTGNATGIAAPGAGLTIGNSPEVIASFTAGFGGTVDEVDIYNFPLTAAQEAARFAAGTDMTQGDLVKLTEQGGDGTVIYTGLVEDIPDEISLAPKFQVLLNPLVVELADTFFSNNYSAPTDLAQMVRDAIVQTGHLTYTSQSVPLTGILAEIDFTDATALQVLETARKFAGATYWWFVDQNGLVWFQSVDTTLPAKLSTARGDFNARVYQSPISALKNKVLCIGNIPPNKAVPITSLYSDVASQKRYGVRYHHPPLVYPNVADQPTLDLVAASVGSMLNRRQITVELTLPNTQMILLGQNLGATLRYWEPNKNPLLEATYGAGRFSKTFICLNVELDGPWQKVLVGELPITPDDIALEAQRIQMRNLLEQVLHPGLSTTVPGAMSGGMFSDTVGQLPTLPSGFTGWSLDAQNGLSLYNGGVLIARYGSSGGGGVLQAYGGYQPVDSTHKATLRYELPANVVQSLTKSFLSFSLKPFRASSQGTSGASSSATTTSQNHSHHMFVGNVGGGNAATITNGPGSVLQTPPGSTPDSLVTNVDGSHSHDNPHTHSVNAPDGLYDTGMAQGVHVFIDGTDRTTALGGPWGSGSALDVSDLDISAFITATGWHEILLSSTTLGVVIAQVTTKAQISTV